MPRLAAAGHVDGEPPNAETLEHEETQQAERRYPAPPASASRARQSVAWSSGAITMTCIASCVPRGGTQSARPEASLDCPHPHPRLTRRLAVLLLGDREPATTLNGSSSTRRCTPPASSIVRSPRS